MNFTEFTTNENLSDTWHVLVSYSWKIVKLDCQLSSLITFYTTHWASLKKLIILFSTYFLWNRWTKVEVKLIIKHCLILIDARISQMEWPTSSVYMCCQFTIRKWLSMVVATYEKGLEQRNQNETQLIRS